MKMQLLHFFSLLLLLAVPTLSQTSSGRKFHLKHKAFKYLQENLLSASLNRAQLNYGIVFDCRSTSNVRKGSESHFVLQLSDLRSFHRLDPNKKLAVFLHGWNDKNSIDWVDEMLLTWTSFQPDYSVCVVDWSQISQNDYKTATMSIFDVGLTVAAIIESLEQLRPNYITRQNITLVGYSLGAHAAGFAGSALNGELEQIIGLDPAGPLFTLPAVVSTQFRLDPNDAQFVQVLHTSSGTLGSSLKCGHADFYPNGGKVPQANCRSVLELQSVLTVNPMSCSHSMAAVFFKYSLNPSLPFVGYHCDSYRSFLRGQCAKNRRGRFGMHSKRMTRGNFYFDTLSDKPFVNAVSMNLPGTYWWRGNIRRYG